MKQEFKMKQRGSIDSQSLCLKWPGSH